MRKVSLMLLTVSIVIAFTAFIRSPAQSQDPKNHSEWIAKSLNEMQTIKVGMTRSELLKVFKEEGGISNRAWRRYVYRECSYIKVDAEFEPVEEPQDKLTQHPNDKIAKISKPFLEWSIVD
jgi:hypothetical protein